MKIIIKILGIISIILGIGLIIWTWEFSFWALGYMSLYKSLGGVNCIFKGLLGLVISILVTGGFIASGIGMIRRKNWAVVLFVILLIVFGVYLTFYFKAASSVQTLEDWHKQLEEKVEKDLQELERQREYLRLQQEQ